MNILIPHSWLLEHLETNATEKEIQKNLSLCGPSVERIYDKENESVYDIEVTTNRVDSMSVRGIAREAAVILQNFGIDAKLKNLNFEMPMTDSNTLPMPVINNDPNLSKRVICVILKDVKKAPTPDWMGKRLLQTDQNIHDATIDITNYITHELGHPCHAFDYDKLMQTGGVINVVEAKKGETFTTLDGNVFETVGGEVVFKNGNNEIIDLPSIKGTANTSVDANTKNILLLLESIKAEKVRFASMTHAIRTTAAQLMEKNVDPNLAELVIKRGIELYTQICEAKLGSKIYDDFPAQKEAHDVVVSFKTISNYLGINLEKNNITDILNQLECETKVDGETLIVTPPTFRPDLNIEADIVEEIARIYGYHNLPSKLMDTTIPLIRPENVNFTIEDRIKRFLSSIGLQEIYSYSMVSKEIAEKTDSTENHLKLQNPLTDDRIYLRKSLLPSLEEIIDQNTHVSDLSVFEIANTYLPRENDLPIEELYLAIVSTHNYRELRGYVEAIFEKLYITDYEFVVKNDQQADIVVKDKNDKEINLGQIMILEKNRVGVSIHFKKLLQVVKTHPTYQPIPKTAPLIEDMTFTLLPKTKVGDVLKTVQSVSNLVKKVELKDQYKQNYTLTITYHDNDRNLSNEIIEPIRKEVSNTLREKLGAELVGSL